jgi:apoptosis-inducing factor 2
VVDWQEQKQAAKAPKHAQIAAANILSQISGVDPKQTYSGQPELIVITNGKVRCCSSRSGSFYTFLTICPHVLQKYGIAYMGMLWGITLGNWFSSSMKGKELMVGMMRKAYGLPK